MKTSLVIVTKNRPQELRRCLDSVLSQKKQPQEIVVVYHQKSDLFLLKGLTVTLKTVQCVAANTARARNLGLRKAKGDLVIFLDDDCVVKKNWFNNINFFFRQYPKANVVMGRNLQPKGGSIYSRIENQRVNDLVQKHLFRYQKRHRASLFLDSKNFAVRRRFLIQNQIYFDSHFKNAYVDVDLGWQIWSLKEPVYYDSNIEVFHYGRSSLLKHLLREIKYGYNYQVLINKWFNYSHRYLLSRLITVNLRQLYLLPSQNWVLDRLDNGLRSFGGLLARVLRPKLV